MSEQERLMLVRWGGKAGRPKLRHVLSACTPGQLSARGHDGWVVRYEVGRRRRDQMQAVGQDSDGCLRRQAIDDGQVSAVLEFVWRMSLQEWARACAEQIRAWAEFVPHWGTGGRIAQTTPHRPPRAPIAHACAS